MPEQRSSNTATARVRPAAHVTRILGLIVIIAFLSVLAGVDDGGSQVTFREIQSQTCDDLLEGRS